MLQPGKYVGKVCDYYVAKSKSEDPLPRIVFNVALPDGGSEFVTWSGNFKTDKSRAVAYQTFITCGARSAAVDAIAKGPASGFLNVNDAVMLDVTHEQFEVVNPQGLREMKTVARANWVNPIGGSKFKNAMSDADFTYCALNMGLNAEFGKMLVTNGVPVEAPKPAAANVSLDEIPF